MENAIDSIYVFCAKMGADAHVNFKIDVVEKEYFNIMNPVVLPGLNISGTAIN
jgi:hypothetical protein